MALTYTFTCAFTKGRANFLLKCGSVVLIEPVPTVLLIKTNPLDIIKI